MLLVFYKQKLLHIYSEYLNLYVTFQSRTFHGQVIDLLQFYGRNSHCEQTCCRVPMKRLQTAQPTSGGVVTADTNCYVNCVETSRFTVILGKPAMQTRCMAGAAPHKSM